MLLNIIKSRNCRLSGAQTDQSQLMLWKYSAHCLQKNEMWCILFYTYAYNLYYFIIMFTFLFDFSFQCI